jgi:hypothetical protein
MIITSLYPCKIPSFDSFKYFVISFFLSPFIPFTFVFPASDSNFEIYPTTGVKVSSYEKVLFSPLSLIVKLLKF